DVGAVAQADGGEDRQRGGTERALGAGPPPEAEAVTGMRPAGERAGLDRREGAEDAGALEGARKHGPGPGPGAESTHGLAGDGAPLATSTTRTRTGPRMICQCSVRAESTSSSPRSTIAPTTGPNSVPIPPRITMNMISPDRVQCMNSGVRYSVWFASSAPARPHAPPARTKATSL